MDTVTAYYDRINRLLGDPNAKAYIRIRLDLGHPKIKIEDSIVRISGVPYHIARTAIRKATA